MNGIKLKQKLKNKEKIFATWNSFSNPQILEIFSNTGAHFAGLDIEHSTISQEQAQRLIATAKANHMAVLPRIASHNMEMIKRFLDSGADGVIIPMVSNENELKNLISWTLYPPKGSRSFGIARAQNYGFNFDEYVKNWNASAVIIIQIESMEGVNNIERLLSYEAVDGVMIGPYDLSGSIGVPGQLQHPSVIEACKKVKEAAIKYNKSFGTHLIEPNDKNVKEAFDFGYNFIILASDVFALWKWSANIKEIISSQV